MDGKIFLRQNTDTFTFSAEWINEGVVFDGAGGDGDVHSSADGRRHDNEIVPPTTATTATTTTCKRVRPLADVDGLHTDLFRTPKRRRLQFTLVTSRLSSPFFSPPPRGVSVPVRRRRGVNDGGGSSVHTTMRKAAILNKIKRDALAREQEKETEKKKKELLQQRLRKAFGSVSGIYLITVRKERNLKALRPPDGEGG